MKDKIFIKFDNGEVVKNFIPISFFDLPVEYISDDGKYYLLWIDDDELGEWWYVVQTDTQEILAYLEGKISPRDILEKGKTFVGFRYSNDYYSIKNLEPLNKKLEEGFLSKDELPSREYRLQLDRSILEKIKNEIYIPLKVEILNLNPIMPNVNLEHNLTMKIDVGKIFNEKDKLPYLSTSYKRNVKINTNLQTNFTNKLAA